MSDQYGSHQYNRYGAPPQGNGQYDGYGGQPGNYPAQNQYGQPPQNGYYQPAPAYNQQPHAQYTSYGQQQNYPPPYSAGPQQGGYPGEYGHETGSYMNQPQEGRHSPYPPQQQFHQGESASYYDASSQVGYPGQAPGPAGQEGEKGLGSSILGAAGGGIVGHKLGGGFLGTAGGALIGAIRIFILTCFL
ncbi:hypothetical protein BDV26DRAFT_274639 [Aspergillus bertholletiae]|uniref:Glycine zipper 2TM domain-containing protein n=1 Tax=Aspergillus bertholletiae TaxID=1226010 RepID=A0A5N7AQP9_9EURO|nr:hypothetical protein BDV26DRAFT_274639 [Aspergillus bertholletiae]